MRLHAQCRRRLTVAFAIASACALRSLCSFRSATSLTPTLSAAAPAASAFASAVSLCDKVRDEELTKISQRLLHWEKVANEGRTILGYGSQAGKLLNRTLDSFDNNARQKLGDSAPCAAQREALEKQLQQQLYSIFLVQRSTVEQVLYQRLKKELLRRMRRKRRELDVKEKLKLLHSSMAEYDSQARELLPFFIQNSESERAERRLAELQWGIDNTPEGKELKNRWKMDRLRRMPMRQSKGISVSLSPGFRLMFRPQGFGNMQLYSKRQVGPPHNPSEVSIGVLNDGNVIDVYNKKPKPPLVKFQPTVGIDISAG